MKKNTLTVEQAFKAMVYFLEHEYELTKADSYEEFPTSFDLGGLLSSLDWTLWDAPGPSDPAAWEDWLEAVKKVLESGEDDHWGSEVMSQR